MLTDVQGSSRRFGPFGLTALTSAPRQAPEHLPPAVLKPERGSQPTATSAICLRPRPVEPKARRDGI